MKAKLKRVTTDRELSVLTRLPLFDLRPYIVINNSFNYILLSREHRQNRKRAAPKTTNNFPHSTGIIREIVHAILAFISKCNVVIIV